MNYIYTYYQHLKDGSASAGEYIHLWYEKVVKDLENKVYYFDPKAAQHVIDYGENYCRHHEGALAPNKIKLEEWQKAFLSVVFGCKDYDTGARHYREIVLIMGRKNGKTLLAALVSSYCAFKDGEYGGRIYMAAPKLAQASLCFNAFYQMVKKEPALDKRAKKRRTDIYIENSNTTIAPLAFSAKRSDGLNCSCVIADEIASWQGDAGLKFYEVLKSSVGARKQPIILNITTAGYIDNGIYDELMVRCTRVLKGDSQESRLAPFLYMIDDVSRWDCIDELAKANPNLGVSISVDYLLEEIRIAEGSLSKRSEVLTKYANVKQNSSTAWLSSEAVKYATGDGLTFEDFRSSYAIAGVDLSMTTDLTSACVIIERDGEYYVFSHFWLPSAKLEEATARDGVPYNIMIQKGLLSLSGDGFIDYADVYDWFVMLVEEYEILPLCVGYDRYSAQYLIKDLNEYGFKTDSVYQGYNLTPAVNDVEGLLNSKKLHIGNNVLLMQHMLDTALTIDADSNRRKIVKISPHCHIDGVAAILCALIVKQKWYEEIGEQLKNED